MTPRERARDIHNKFMPCTCGGKAACPSVRATTNHIRAALAAEREACAKLAAGFCPDGSDCLCEPNHIAAAIRSRARGGATS